MHFFAYRHYEEIPLALNLFDKHNINVSSFMIGKAVENAPDIAQEIVRRGHEAAAYGRTWSNSYNLSQDEEKRFIADTQETIHRVTGQIPHSCPFPESAFCAWSCHSTSIQL